MTRRLLFAGLLALIVASPLVGTAEELHATPYRPTVSNPAALPIPGVLELEAGWLMLKEKAVEAQRHNVPFLLKFAFNEHVGLLLGGSAVQVRHVDQGATVAGFGDLTPLLKVAAPSPLLPHSLIGFEAGITFPTAPTTLGSGGTDYVTNAIWSAGVGRVGFDVNIGYTRLGLAGVAEGKNQLTWALATSLALTDRWSMAGEWAGTSRIGVKPFSQWLTSTSYAVQPWLIIDTGVAVGLTSVSQEWSVFAGWS